MSGPTAGILRFLGLLTLAYVVTSILMAGRDIFHGNHESHALHEPGCRFYDAKNCTETFRSRRAALEAGYHPARCCSP